MCPSGRVRRPWPGARGGFQVESSPRERGPRRRGRRAGWELGAAARRAGAFGPHGAPRGWWGDGGDGFAPPPRTPMAELFSGPPPSFSTCGAGAGEAGRAGSWAKGRREGGGCVVQAAAAGGGRRAGREEEEEEEAGSRVARSSRRGSPGG